MNKFTLFWIGGKKETIQGIEISDAFRRSGYGNGSMKALDFYEEGNKMQDWQWSTQDKRWVKVLTTLGELSVNDKFHFTEDSSDKIRQVIQKGFKDSYCPLIGQDTSSFTKEGGEECYFHTTKVIKIINNN